MREHSYHIVKMMLNQFGTAVFGFALAVAAGKAQNAVLRNVTSVFAILFYLFLLYVMTWEIGFKDKTAVEHGRKPFRPLMGLYLSLAANAVNFLFAVFITLATFFDVGFLSTVGGISASAAVLLEGMYSGILVNPVAGAPLNSYWWVWFLITVPSMLTCLAAYLMGIKDKKFTGIFNVPLPESDREPKIKK